MEKPARQREKIRDSALARSLTVANPPGAMPETSTANITLRRLQVFRVHPGNGYRWRLLRDGKSIASGTVLPDAANLLTIPRVTLNLTPAELVIEQAAGEESLVRKATRALQRETSPTVGRSSEVKVEAGSPASL